MFENGESTAKYGLLCVKMLDASLPIEISPKSTNIHVVFANIDSTNSDSLNRESLKLDYNSLDLTRYCKNLLIVTSHCKTNLTNDFSNCGLCSMIVNIKIQNFSTFAQFDLLIMARNPKYDDRSFKSYLKVQIY